MLVWCAGLWGLAFVLLAALAWKRWRVAAVLGALFALPHMVEVPVSSSPLSKPLFYGLKRWFGPIGTCKVVDLRDPNERNSKQMFCAHPHGIYTAGVLLICEALPEVTPLSSPYLYHFAPSFHFGIKTLMGRNYGSVGRADLTATMRAGEGPLMLVPGGFHEATITCPGHERVFLKSDGIREVCVAVRLRSGTVLHHWRT